jgi:hypothetical protein
MATINKIDGINISVITKLVGRERAAFAKRTRHTFGGGASSSGVAGVSNGIWTDNGSGQGNYSGINLSTANIIDYTNGEATSDEFTISWWQNLDSSQAAANIAVLGQHGRLKVDLGNVGTGITNPHFKVTFGATLDYVQNTNTGVQMGSTWVHCAVVCKSDGSQLVISSYLNGTKLSKTGTKSLGTKLLPNDATEFRIGGHAGSGSSVKGQFDSIQVSSTPLDDYQVGALAGQSDRQMTIATASQLTPIQTWFQDFEIESPGVLSGDSYEDYVFKTNNRGWSHSTFDKFVGDIINVNPDQLVMSVWFKANENINAYSTKRHLISTQRLYNKGFTSTIQPAGDGLNHVINIKYSSSGVSTDSWSSTNIPSFRIQRDHWYNFVITLDKTSDAANNYMRVYLDGVKVKEITGIDAGANFIPNKGSTFGVGSDRAGSSQATSESYDFDSFQMVKDVSLSDTQVAAIYAQSDREMTIAEAAALPTYLESTADLYGDADTSGGTLALDGTGDYAVLDDGFRFTDKLSTSVWFKTTSTGDRRIYSAHVRGMSGGDFNNGFFARLNNGQLKYRHPAGGSGELTGPSGLNDGNWHHLSVTWEANVGYVMYLDGVQLTHGMETSRTATGLVKSPSSKLLMMY